jgi:hypothetical protein
VAHAGGHVALAAVIAQRAGLAVFPLRVPHHVCGIVHPVIPRTAGVSRDWLYWLSLLRLRL